MKRVLLVLLLVPPLQSPSPKLRIVTPQAADRLAGDVTLAAEIRGAPAVSVDFFVDGVRACRVPVPPFECHWNAGTQVQARTIRAVATLRDGRTLVATTRTSASRASFRSSADVVLIPTSVTDRRGRPVVGLSQGDFRIREDGVDQAISMFTSQEAPCSILLMLDTSGSMAPHMDTLKSAVRAFLARTRPQDAVTVAAFDTALRVVVAAGADAGRRGAAIEALKAGGGTALYDALAGAAELLKEQPAPRVLVMFTDGDDVSSRASPETARRALQDADTVLYFIGQGKAADDHEGRKRVEALTGETGGEAFFTSNISAVAVHLQRILAEASTLYLLGYTPQKPLGDGAWRSIDVALTGKDLARKSSVRTRAGYFAVRRGAQNP